MKKKLIFILISFILVLLLFFIFSNFNKDRVVSSFPNKSSNFFNLSNITCDGRANPITVPSNGSLIRIELPLNYKWNVLNLINSSFPGQSFYELNLVKEGGMNFNESYFVISNLSFMDNLSIVSDGGGSIYQISNDTVEFLTIISSSEINFLQNQASTWDFDHGTGVIFINSLENESSDIFYTCDVY